MIHLIGLLQLKTNNHGLHTQREFILVENHLKYEGGVKTISTIRLVVLSALASYNDCCRHEF